MINTIIDHINDRAKRNIDNAYALDPICYTNSDFFIHEKNTIFNREWFCVGRSQEFTKVGDYKVVEIASNSIIIVRDSHKKLRAFANICRHRLMRLVEESGNSKNFRCPYHGWCYNIDGALTGAPTMNKNKLFNKQQLHLHEYIMHQWHGWVYVSLHDTPSSFDDHMHELSDIMSIYNLKDYIPVIRQEHHWNTNWKLISENFMESYHLPVAHEATVGKNFFMDKTIFRDKASSYHSYQFFTKEKNATYGLAHPNNTTLPIEWCNRSVLATIFPCHLMVLAPDHCWYLSLLPDAVNSTKLIFGVLLAPDIEQDVKNNPAQLNTMTDFFDLVNDEDKFLTETVYRNMDNMHAKAGPLSPEELSLHDFYGYLARML